MRLRGTLAGGCLLALLVWFGATAAGAEITRSENGFEIAASGDRKVDSQGGADSASPSRASKPKYRYLPKDEYRSAIKDYRTKLAAAAAKNRQLQASYVQCIARVDTTSCGAYRQTALPDDPNIRQAGDPVEPVVPVLSPQEVAYVAAARIRLTAPRPMVGPSPELNEWKMAAVGYPLWLWAEGTLDPAPVADSVYDISVGLDARLVSVVFDMGDGHKVTCSDVGREWTAAVAAGEESPSCGYRYPKPSLPQGSYKVTANAVWAIDWNVNGTTGSIPFYQSASTTIPVGELQVLTR